MKKFSELRKDSLVHSFLEGKYFDEVVVENLEYDCDEYTWELKTDLDSYQLTEFDLEKDFVILENFDGIKQYIATSMDRLLLELEEC